MGKKSKNKLKAARPKSTQRLPRCNTPRCNSYAEDPDNKCPGCERSFCKPCSQLLFVSCPNGEDKCALPMSRCRECVVGITARNLAIEKCGTNLRRAIKQAIEEGREAFAGIENENKKAPFWTCGLCSHSVCAECANSDRSSEGEDLRRFMACDLCYSMRCYSCVGKSFAKGDEYIACCTDCDKEFCSSCIPMHKDKKTHHFRCDTCYWATKPCTNPDCPNELGVPTKRCGDCRRSRYCSKQCQLAMWPRHVEDCKRICKARTEKILEQGAGFVFQLLFEEALNTAKQGIAQAEAQAAAPLPTLEEKHAFSKNLYKISKEELGKVIFQLDALCPAALTKGEAEESIEINVDKISPLVFGAVSTFVKSVVV